MSTRQLQFDRARQLAHVGLEEALWALNKNSWSSSGPAGASSWATSGSDRTVTINYGSLGQGANGVAVLTITNYASTGPTWPAITSAATITLTSGATYTKTLQATTKSAPLFGYAVATDNGLVRFSAGGTVDSYDSSLGSYGQTTAPFSVASPNIGAAAVVAGTSVTITSATINGYAQTNGNAVTYTAGLGKVKALAAASMDTDRLGKSAYVPAFTVTEPSEGTSYTGRLTGGSQTIGTPGGATEYWYTDSTGWTYPSDLNLSFGETLNVNGPVKVRVYDDLSITSSGKINVTANGRLELFVGDDVTISGTGGIVNNTTGNLPKNVVLFSSNSRNGSRAFNYTCSADYTGVIYSTDGSQVLTIGSNATFSGAILAQSNITFSSGYNPTIHYDTALRNLTKNWFSSVTTPFVINLVTEL